MGKSILTADQQRLLELAVASPEITDRFYLTGGTALSEFYFQHRISEDFDFFTELPLVETDVKRWVQVSSHKLKVREVEYQVRRGQLTFFYHFPQSVVKLDFAYYPFAHIGEWKKYGKLRVASVLDIGVNKIQAIQTRKRGRDFVDLYVMLNQGGLDLPTLQKQYRNKFDVGVSDQELAVHLAGVVDATDQPRFLGRLQWAEVEAYCLSQARLLSGKMLAK